MTLTPQPLVVLKRDPQADLQNAKFSQHFSRTAECFRHVTKLSQQSSIRIKSTAMNVLSKAQGEVGVSRVQSRFPSFHLFCFCSPLLVSENRETDLTFLPCRRNADGEMLHSSLSPLTPPSLINQETSLENKYEIPTAEGIGEEKDGERLTSSSFCTRRYFVIDSTLTFTNDTYHGTE